LIFRGRRPPHCHSTGVLDDRVVAVTPIADRQIDLSDPVAQRDVWEAHDPYYLAQQLKSLPVYLSSGDGSTGPLDPPGRTDALNSTVSAPST
jgi:hypothetical protein